MQSFEFLVDVNLPKHFSFFNKPEFTFVADINKTMTDKQVWEYALENNKIILTKDADFFNRSILSKQKPKVVYFEIGNLTIQELHKYFEKNWTAIKSAFNEFNLIVAEKSRIRGIF
jgi:predicted nuclease of predicted toxin-antitoxin system